LIVMSVTGSVSGTAYAWTILHWLPSLNVPWLAWFDRKLPICQPISILVPGTIFLAGSLAAVFPAPAWRFVVSFGIVETCLFLGPKSLRSHSRNVLLESELLRSCGIASVFALLPLWIWHIHLHGRQAELVTPVAAAAQAAVFTVCFLYLPSVWTYRLIHVADCFVSLTFWIIFVLIFGEIFFEDHCLWICGASGAVVLLASALDLLNINALSSVWVWRQTQKQFHAAVTDGRTDVAEGLLMQGANPNVPFRFHDLWTGGIPSPRARNQFGRFGALHHAAVQGDDEMVRMLLEHGADTDQFSLQDALRQPFFSPYALAPGEADLLRFDNIPLHFAVENRHADVVQLLLAHADDGHLRSALHVAVCTALPEDDRIIRALLQARACPSVHENGLTALHCAAMRGGDHLCTLLEHVTEPTQLNVQIRWGWLRREHPTTGNTPLHCAAWCIDQATVGLLLDHGADPNALNAAGLTPATIRSVEETPQFAPIQEMLWSHARGTSHHSTHQHSQRWSRLSSLLQVD